MARLKSFSKAAENLFLSQPTVSAHIKSLEEELETKLFFRSTREITLTQSGRAFLPFVIEIMSLKDEAMLHLNKLNTSIAGDLIISASTVPAQYLLPEFLPHLMAKYPKLNFTVRQSDSHQVMEEVLNLETDLGFCALKTNSESLNFIPLLEDPLVVITPNNEYFSLFGESLPLQEYGKNNFIFREEGSGTRKETEIILEEIGFDPKLLKRKVQLNSTEAVLQGVKHGMGLSIVSARAAAAFAESNQILTFPLPQQEYRKIYLVHRRNHPLSPACAAFIEEAVAFWVNPEEGV